MKTNSIETDFQNFYISWKGSKSISWTFLGSLHNETIVKYVFHEIPYTVKYLFLAISWNTYFTVSLCKLPRNVHDILFETFHEIYKNSENRFSEFSLSWKTLLLNLFPCLINSFVINDVYKSLKENVSITWKASKVVFVFWEAVVQRCSVKKVLKKETLAQVFSCEFCEISKNTFFIEHLWWLLLYFILQNLKDTEDRLE